jgi:hypothetical protein
MGFDSEESFAEMDEDGNVANRIRVQVMELKPVEIKKATKKRARGEDQTPFGKMVKCDNFVYIFHGERFVKRGAPVDKTLVLEQSLGKKFIEIVVGALTVSPLPDGGCSSFFFPSFLDLLGAISRSARHELLGGCGEGAERFGWIGALQEGEGGVRLYLGDLESSWWIADWKHSFYSALPRG